jgi:putative ABC transport system permease protein
MSDNLPASHQTRKALGLLPLRLLRHRRSSAAAFVLLYSLGLGVFLWVDGLWRRVETGLETRARELLEADVQIDSRRPLTAAESLHIASAMPLGTRRSEAWGFVSMLATPQGESRLVQIKAIDKQYPIYGNFTFDTGSYPLGSKPFTLADWGPGEVLAPPGLLASLGLKVGDSVRLGSCTMGIRAIYTDRPGGGFDLFEMNGRIYMHLNEVASTGLDQKGSRIFRYQFFGLPDEADPSDASAIKKRLESPLEDPEIHVRSAADKDSDLGRILGNVGGFIKVLALGAYFLAAVGGGFFFARHLEAERRQAALLRTLGLRPLGVRIVYAAQCLGLSLLASGAGLALATGLAALAAPWVKASYGVDLPVGLPLITMLLGLVVPACTALLFAARGLWQMGSTPPAALLRAADPPGLPWLMTVSLWLAQAGWVLLFARLISRSWLLAAYALGALVVAYALLACMAWLTSEVLWRLRSHLGYADRVILGSIRLRASRALTAFFALGFTAFAIALLPLLRASLSQELASPKGHRLPSLFLFDVQEEQESGVRTLLQEQEAPLQSLAAMVRARLLAVNGETFKRNDDPGMTLEQKAKNRMRNRGFNLSWRDTLSKSETLVEGKFWEQGGSPETDSTLPQISVERDFARKLDLQMGDTLLFDVQGVELAGRITSLRRVRWNSFQPNFFVLFQPGVLDDAPKTFIGTVATVPQRTANLRNLLVKAYPNVSVMEVSEAIARLDSLMGQLQRMVGLLSWGYLVIGLCMLLTVLEGSVRDGRRSLLLLRALGAPEKTLGLAFARHYVAFAVLAALGGLGLAVGAAWLVHAFMWDIAYAPPWGLLPWGLLAGVAVGLLAGTWAALRARGGSLRTLLASSRGD